MSSMFTFRITPDFRLETPWLSLRFERAAGGLCSLTRRGHDHVVYLAQGVRLEEPRTQTLVNDIVVEVLRLRAEEELHVLFARLAAKAGVSFRRVVVKNVRTHWGSCSAGGNVNLSLWLMLLPKDLVRYVLLHEMAHLDEMNHSARFWARVDELMGSPGAGRAAERKLRNYVQRVLEPMVRGDGGGNASRSK